MAGEDFVDIQIEEPKTSTRTKSRGFGFFGGSKNKNNGEKRNSIQDLAGDPNGSKSNRGRISSMANS